MSLNTSRNRISLNIPTPLDIFSGRLFGYWNSRNYSTNVFGADSLALSGASWTKQGIATVIDGYADPFGGNNASLFIQDTSITQHRFYHAIVVTNNVAYSTIYFKPISPTTSFGILTATATILINPQTNQVITQTNGSCKVTLLSDGWRKVDFKIQNSTALNHVFYPFSTGIGTLIGTSEQVLIYNPTLNNNQPDSIPDLSGNNRTFTKNTAGGIVDSSNATIARFGQPSITTISAQGYLLNEGLNSDYTAIILGALDNRRVITTAQSQTFFDNTNVAGTERHSILTYATPTSAQDFYCRQYFNSVAAGANYNTLNTNYNDSNFMIYNCFYPVTGNLSGSFNNGPIRTFVKSGSDGTKTKMILGNGVDFNAVTAKQHFFECIIVNGALSATDNTALNLYIKNTYNQYIF